jgi:hypothetical protein
METQPLTSNYFVERKIIIPACTKLYRCAKDTSLTLRKCSDTKKYGCYFSTYMLQAMAMSFEYGEDLQLGIFETTEPIICYFGKYNYQKIRPKRYYHNICGCYVFPKHLEKELEIPINENINHFDPGMFPILDIQFDLFHMMFGRFQSKLKKTDGEVFIGNYTDLGKIRLIDTYEVKLDGLIQVLRKNNYEPFSKDYFKHLKKID